MLLSLSIENFAVIEKLNIDFENGFNVLTGETGAGKSIIIGCINAILGERVNKDMIRSGATKARITAEFAVDNSVLNEYLKQYDIEQSETLIISRTLSLDGKTTARINGLPVTVSILKTIASELVAISGQHDSQKLLQSSSHLNYIDSMADVSNLLNDYRCQYSELLKLKDELKNLNLLEEQKNIRKDYLEYQINELESANITPGEFDSLNEQKKIINNRDNIISTINSIVGLINGDDSNGGVSDMLYLLSSQLTQLKHLGYDYLSTGELVDSLRYELADCASDLLSNIENLEFENYSIDDIETRLDLLYKLFRKYGGNEIELIQNLESFKAEYSTIVNADKRRHEIITKIEQQQLKVDELAETLSKKRKSSAKIFEKKVSDELQYLNMKDAQFEVEIKETSLNIHGKDEVSFLISPNIGQDMKPLNKIASGGELSRIMLAIRCALSANESTDTMIFDEIDTGVSGVAAGAIAKKLMQLSTHKQVICVSHLAQIAAAANHHMLIEKQSTQFNTYTNVFPLDLQGRKNEIARIISGDEITQSVLNSAEEMINYYKKERGNI